jgi:hypothetical protein
MVGLGLTVFSSCVASEDGRLSEIPKMVDLKTKTKIFL